MNVRVHFSKKETISNPAINEQRGSRNERGGYNNNIRAPKCVLCRAKGSNHYFSRCTNHISVTARREKVRKFRCYFNYPLPRNLPNSHNAIDCPI